ncbi:hypothetical protein ACHAXS_007573 [Conticribra weissflogii]
MAKSIRSKSKRKNRTEFRNTIGDQAAKANMAIVQAKLQQCISSGQLNSFDRLSNLFSGNTANTTSSNAGDDASNGGDDVEMKPTTTILTPGKDSGKIPAKKAKSQKHIMDKMSRQCRDNTARKVNEKSKRGRIDAGKGSGQSRLRSSSKKRSGKRA